MRTFAKSLFLVLLFIALGSVSQAQDLSLKGRSAIEFGLGFWGGAKASNTFGPTGIQSEAGINGFAGGLGYAYWLRENLSLTLGASLLSASARSTVSGPGVVHQASVVVPILLGMRFYIPEPQSDENIRPFLSAAVGSYIGSESANTLFAQQSHVENAFGGRLGAGVDFFLGNHFKLGANVGYHVMTDFEVPVGARKNYNGGEFALGAGYVF